METPGFLKKYGVKRPDWQYVVKEGSWRPLQRPGYDLRVRIGATCQLHAMGYPAAGGEFCVMSIGREGKDGPHQFAPLTGAAIKAELFRVAVAEFARSEVPLSDQERERLRIPLTNIRRICESMEFEDGVLTRVTLTKYLSADAATRKLAGADLKRLMTAGLSFEQARELGLITPLHEVAPKDRQRLAGKSFLYFHVHPRPARGSALRRKTIDDFTGMSAATNGLRVDLGAPTQLMLRLVRGEGLDDPKLAASLATRPDVQAHLDKTERIKAELRESEAATRECVHGLVAVYKESGVLPATDPVRVQADLFPPVLVPSRVNGHAQVSAALNSNGAEASGAYASDSRAGLDQPTPAARAADAVKPGPGAGGQGPGKPAGANGAPAAPGSVAPAAFHEALCERFTAVGAGPPTRGQSNPAHKKLGADAGAFLEWLSPAEMQRRKPKHAGLLPSLIEEFRRKRAAWAAGERARTVAEPTREEKTDALRWLAAHDEDPAARESAVQQLAEMGAQGAVA